MTYMQAALTVLAHASRPLTVPEITAVAVAQGLVRPRGKTPDRTMSSVLYRRMASDPDAPVFSRGGRVWVHGRPLPEEETAYLSRPARRARGASGPTPAGASRQGTRRITVLPAPPLRLPDEALVAPRDGLAVSGYTPGRWERAMTRGGERGARLLKRLAESRAVPGEWDASRTAARLVAPLLAHLGYRAGREAVAVGRVGRGRTGYVLRAGGSAAIALDVWRLGHAPGDDDAWHALGRAQELGAPYGAVTNGQELRVYAAGIAEAQDSVAAAHILTLALEPTAEATPARAEQAAALWLLARQNVASGALDSYTANRAVGSALAGALEDASSPLARVLVAEVGARLGAPLPAGIVLRHARLVLRGQRGLEGEPLAQDTPTVAAVRGPRLAPAVVTAVPVLALEPAGDAVATAV